MPRYFFDVLDDDGSFRDEVGLDLPDMDTAIVEARKALVDMTREMLADPAQRDVQICIRDGNEGPVRMAVSLKTMRSGS